METIKQDFYLLMTLDENGKKLYAQRLESSKGNSYGLSHHPEYGKRFTDIMDVMKFKIDIEYSNSFMSNKDFEIVKYNMDTDQRSWANIPKEVNHYDNLYVDKKMSIHMKEELERYEESKREIY